MIYPRTQPRQPFTSESPNFFKIFPERRVLGMEDPDHRMITTVQSHYKTLKKPVVTTNNGLFPVLGAAVQNRGTQGIASAP